MHIHNSFLLPPTTPLKESSLLLYPQVEFGLVHWQYSGALLDVLAASLLCDVLLASLHLGLACGAGGGLGHESHAHKVFKLP